MVCNKCGNEIKDDELYCSKCGNKLKNNDKKVIKIKFNHLIIGIILIIILFSIIMFLIINNVNNKTEKQVHLSETSKSDDNYELKLNEEYNCITGEYSGYIKFISKNEFEMRIGNAIINNSTTTKGTYSINDKIITIKITYDTDYLIEDTNEMNSLFSEYEKSFKIIDENTLAAPSEYESDIMFKIGGTNNNNLEHNDWSIDEDISYSNSEETINRKTFLNNLTDENKEVIREYIEVIFDLTSKNISSYKEFVEDRFEIYNNNEIIYTYIYTRTNNKMKPDICADIFVITPSIEVTKNLNMYNIVTNLVAKRATTVADNFDKPSNITRQEVKDKLKKLEPEIQEKITFFKCKAPTETQIQTIIEGYSNYIKRSENISSSEFQVAPILSLYKKYPIIKDNKILNIELYEKKLPLTSIYEEIYKEYMIMGIYLELNQFPIMCKDFSIEELVLTGYLPADYSNNFFMVQIPKMKSNVSIDEIQKICEEKNREIHQHFNFE